MNKIEYYPSLEEMEKEVRRLRRIQKIGIFGFILGLSFTFVSLLIIFLTTFYFPMYEITGSSMNPTLTAKNYILTLKTQDIQKEDIIVFQYNGKVMIKRVIALEGDEVDIKEDGAVWVNKNKVIEKYVMDKQLGISNISYPYRVPDGEVFVLNDNRNEMLDSRNKNFGCVDVEWIIGKVKFIF